MLKALLWKEWQEQRGRMALATVWLVGMTAIGLKTRILPDLVILYAIWIGTAVVLSLFVGMGLLASERNRGTLVFLMHQPVGSGKVLAAKVIMGVLAYVVPFIACGTVACLTVSGRELSLVMLLSVIASLIPFGVVILAWQLLVGLSCRKEETYALVGILTLLAWVIFAFTVSAFDSGGRAGVWLWATTPYAILTLPDWTDQPTSENWAVIVIQSLILAGLGLSLWFRFCRLREGRS